MIHKYTGKILPAIILICFFLLTICGCDSQNTIIFSNGEITNSGFEDSTIGKYWATTSSANTINIDSISHSGNQSIKIGKDDTYTATLTQHINGLQPGYYAIEAYTLNDGNQEFCYIYGNGSNQGQCMTSIPRTTKKDEWTKVIVRGIVVEEDGVLELGINVSGNNQYVYFDDLSLIYETNQTEPYETLIGGAISWLDWVEDKGGKYYRADGTEGDALQIMAENGCNFVRLELYNNPGNYANELGEQFPKGYKDADSIFNLAKRATSKDMKIQLSFMYSDYWGNDAIPSDWKAAIEGIENKDEITAILSNCIYQYTKNYMQRLADAGIYPEYVSLGNEMEAGILTPYGQSYVEGDENGDVSAFCSFLDAGYRAVKEVSPNSQVVLHISCNANDLFWEQKSGMGKWFFNICEKNDIKYDVIGISFYPFWAQTTDKYAVQKSLDLKDLIEWCNMMIDEYDKDILIMESGYNWGNPGQLSNNGAYTNIYPSSPEGQRDFVLELLNAIKCVKDGRCVGSLYWDPVLVKQDGIGYAIYENGEARPNVVETTTFFDYNHKALPVLKAYLYNTGGSTQGIIYGKITNADGQILSNTNVTIEFANTTRNILTDKYGNYYTHIDPGNGNIYGNNISISAGDKIQLNFTVQ